MNENAMKSILMKLVPSASDSSEISEYCCYDLETSKSIVELKHRRGDKIYPDSMIERKKFDKNHKIATDAGKDFVYVVASDAHQSIYFFNVSQMYRDGVDLGWHEKMCPATSDFSNNRKIAKEVGGLKWNKAYFVMPYGDCV